MDKALQIFSDMVQRGCERNVITYSSTISACEKAGRTELALQLFEQMHAEGCRPNVVTYNSLIAACSHGKAAAAREDVRVIVRSSALGVPLDCIMLTASFAPACPSQTSLPYSQSVALT